MRRWLTSTLFCAFSLAGCLAHERPEDSADAGHIVLVDTSLEAYDASADAFLAPDAPRPGDADAGPACSSDLVVSVRVEPVTADVARCVFGHAEGASLTGVDPAPSDSGIRIHLDLCPAADADCRCDVVVTNVGTDIAAALGPDANVVVDLAPGEAFFPGAFLAITKTPTCMCDGCGCSEPIYLYAANATPDFAPSVPAPMTFSTGAEVCPARDCSFGGSWMLHARGDIGELDVPGGADRDVGAVHVRSVRDIEVFEPCAACAGCDTPVGAWIAWVTSR